MLLGKNFHTLNLLSHGQATVERGILHEHRSGMLQYTGGHLLRNILCV